MQIQVEDDGKKGRLYIEQNGRQLAEMTYVWSGPGKLIVDHTEVSEELKGKGTGRKLVNHIAGMAREKDFKILPLCPFVRAVFDKTGAYEDVRF